MNYYVIIISYLYVHDGKNKTIVQPYNIREYMIFVSSNIDKEQKYRQQAGMVDYLRSISMTSERVTSSTRKTIYREQLKIVMRLVIFFSGSNQWKFLIYYCNVILQKKEVSTWWNDQEKSFREKIDEFKIKMGEIFSFLFQMKDNFKVFFLVIS